MKPRYYVKQSINSWWVIDRMRTIMLHNEVVVKILATRKEARAHAKELNEEERKDRHIDEQIGETI